MLGLPAPGGSKKPVPGRGRRRGTTVLVDDCDRNAGWRDNVGWTARRAMVGAGAIAPIFDAGALVLEVTFYVPRPRRHFTGAGALRAEAPPFPTPKPDATKLVRALEDALTRIVWHDDAQIVDQVVRKRYADGVPIGAKVSVRPKLVDELELPQGCGAAGRYGAGAGDRAGG